MSQPPHITLLDASELKVRFNDNEVLKSASLTIRDGDHLGMVGRNGCGKSTFLKILAGIAQADDGKVTLRSGLGIGYLPQGLDASDGVSVLDTIRDGAAHSFNLLDEYESLPADSNRQTELEQQIAAADAWNIETRIETAMMHLNTPAADRLMGTLSGGEKRRVALCRSIVSNPDLLILDEPTNHLDTDSIEWMAQYLKKFRGAFLVATHDRYFLDEICNHIVELQAGRFHTHKGNYSDYLESNLARMENEQAIELKRKRFLHRELDWIRRGPKARTTKAKFRVDKFHSIKNTQSPDRELSMDLIIPPPGQLANRVVDLINVSLELGGRKLIEQFDFKFEAGMRIGICGRNGLGKTSLLRIVLGQLAPTGGSQKTGVLTQFNYVDQERVQLDPEKTLLQEVAEGADTISFGNGKLAIRAYLQRFGFDPKRINMKIKSLSGGEKSRLLLARILKHGGNFLIMDEPTNDLDLPTLRLLEEALLAFSGCVLVVSHDRYFLNRVCTGIIAFEGDGLVAYNEGDYEYYREKLAERKMRLAKPPVASQANAGSSRAPEAKPRKMTWKEKAELEGMEAAILKDEEAVARLESLFADPEFHSKHGVKTIELTNELETAKKHVAALYARWEELEAIRAANEKA
ncbi:MAG: ABC-F family ATP-binding cassette domain-containing protein [Verrucomicrobiota bacterium]|nr:ABC-F family ATP-binding cassette domain-containing protein [Verrucomicrobiota bacterium]MDP6914605.1 ABC-F family ATP-binding cassette domain-containing protein [Verrucomicrobiota bacterium]